MAQPFVNGLMNKVEVGVDFADTDLLAPGLQ